MSTHTCCDVRGTTVTWKLIMPINQLGCSILLPSERCHRHANSSSGRVRSHPERTRSSMSSLTPWTKPRICIRRPTIRLHKVYSQVIYAARMSLGSSNCICGKKGTKVCNKCRLAKYCSRQCQVADFPKHKTICCHLSASTDTAAIAQACETLKLLPTYYTVKPWPMSTKVCPRVPLEQLLPQFLCLAVTHHQCVVAPH
jgi:hypothetical protein